MKAREDEEQRLRTVPLHSTTLSRGSNNEHEEGLFLLVGISLLLIYIIF